MKNDIDTQLYYDYLNHDKDAFDILYTKYNNRIKYFIFNIVKDYQKAEDITQDTFVYILKNNIKDNKYSFKNYIYLIAKSKALNYINIEKRRKEIDDCIIDEENIVEQDIINTIVENETKSEVIDAINKLDDKYKNAIYLSKIEDFSIKEISNILGESISNTKVIIHRGKKELQKILIEEKIITRKDILKTFGLILCIGLILSGISYAVYKISITKNDDKKINIIPTFSSKISTFDENKVWVGTFNLVWNDFKNKIGRDIEFEDGVSELAKELNKNKFTKKEINDNSYYKEYGVTNLELKSKIERNLSKKFNEKSEILERIDWNDNNSYILYSMLKKEFTFLEKFPMLKSETFGNSDVNVKYFGIQPDTAQDAKKNIEVLFFNSESDFAVKLKTNEKEEIILYKNNGIGSSFEKIYNEIKLKEMNYTGSREFNQSDIIKIPFINISAEINYDELCGRIIKGTSCYIEQALQTVNFELNNVGGCVKSEAILRYTLGGSIEKGRYFEFTDDFIVFLKEENKEKPYFALRVDNIDVLVIDE